MTAEEYVDKLFKRLDYDDVPKSIRNRLTLFDANSIMDAFDAGFKEAYCVASVKLNKMIEEQYISFETAKMAKEKGFNEFCFHYYNGTKIVDTNGISINNEKLDNEFEREQFYAAPTQSLFIKWLRENHRISVEYYFEKTPMDWSVAVVLMDEICNTIYFTGFNICEEAIEKGLQEALNLIESEEHK